jgi:hypothetical protein
MLRSICVFATTGLVSLHSKHTQTTFDSTRSTRERNLCAPTEHGAWSTGTIVSNCEVMLT